MLLEPRPRNRRRRRALWMVALLSAGFLVYLVVGGFRSDRRQLAGFMDVAGSVADVEAAAAAQFVDLGRGLDEATRPTALAALADVREDLQMSILRLEDASVPSSASLAHAYMTVASRSWLRGVEEAERAILLLVESPAEPEGLSLLEEAMLDLRTGDRTYADFVAEAALLDGELESGTPRFPPVIFAPATLTAQELVVRAQQASDVALTRDLTVETVAMEPRVLAVREDGVGVVPLTEVMNLQITISNGGNALELDIPIQVRVAPFGGGDDFTEDRIIEQLPPGASRALDFEVPVNPGWQYDLIVDLGRAVNDLNEENNVVMIPFAVNDDASEPSPETGG